MTINYTNLKNGELSTIFVNDRGEMCFVRRDDSLDAELYVVTTYQSNGWIRENWYHKDGTIEEIYVGREKNDG